MPQRYRYATRHDQAKGNKTLPDTANAAAKAAKEACFSFFWPLLISVLVLLGSTAVLGTVRFEGWKSFMEPNELAGMVPSGDPASRSAAATLLMA